MSAGPWLVTGFDLAGRGYVIRFKVVFGDDGAAANKIEFIAPPGLFGMGAAALPALWPAADAAARQYLDEHREIISLVQQLAGAEAMPA